MIGLTDSGLFYFCLSWIPATTKNVKNRGDGIGKGCFQWVVVCEVSSEAVGLNKTLPAILYAPISF